jgi:hypothetical protein
MSDNREVSPEEMLSSIAYQLEAILVLLEEKGLLTREQVIEKVRELLDENRRLRQ